MVDSLRKGWIGTGPKVARFEQAFCAYKGVAHAAAVNSCTAALHLSMLAAGLEEGDEVITTALTFCATINAILHVGARPILVDVEASSKNLDPSRIEEKITPRTKAILPVHFAGRPCNMEALVRIAQQHRLRLIEDCAHAIEAEYRGQPIGTFGEFGCFSFYVTKNIITGEGGMVICSKPSDVERIKVLALHGMTHNAWNRYNDEGFKHYWVTEAGFKYNMMDLQAAIGIHQLKRIDTYWEKRKKIWEHYNKAFSDLPLSLPRDPDPDTRHAYHLYTVGLDSKTAGIDRDTFLEAMTYHNIGVGVHYVSIPEHPYYQNRLGWKPGSFPVAQSIGRDTVSLPLSPRLTEEDVDDVVRAVRSILA